MPSWSITLKQTSVADLQSAQQVQGHIEGGPSAIPSLHINTHHTIIDLLLHFEDTCARSQVNTLGRANGVMSYFQLGDEGAATTSKKRIGMGSEDGISTSPLRFPNKYLSTLHHGEHYDSVENADDWGMSQLDRLGGKTQEASNHSLGNKEEPKLDACCHVDRCRLWYTAEKRETSKSYMANR
ncbi:hypothetical protein Tco_1185087 [Tanacetum coccineum]